MLGQGRRVPTRQEGISLASPPLPALRQQGRPQLAVTRASWLGREREMKELREGGGEGGRRVGREEEEWCNQGNSGGLAFPF